MHKELVIKVFERAVRMATANELRYRGTVTDELPEALYGDSDHTRTEIHEMAMENLKKHQDALEWLVGVEE